MASFPVRFSVVFQGERARCFLRILKKNTVFTHYGYGKLQKIAQEMAGQTHATFQRNNITQHCCA